MPPPRTLWIAGALLACGAVLALWALGVPFETVQGSTEAWMMAHAQRLEWVGDYSAAARVGGLPNLSTNPLYPWLVSALSPGPEWVVPVGHAIAAASLGACALALWLAWQPLVGGWAAVAGAGAVLLPTLVATAGQARYDSLAIALVLGVVAATAQGLRHSSPRPWLVAGLLAGLACATREYLGVVALAALLLPAGVAAARAPTLRRRQAPVVGALVCFLVAAAVPLALGLSPLDGPAALIAYGGEEGTGGQAVLQELLGPPGLRVGLSLGMMGWLLTALWPLGRRLQQLPLAAALLPFAGFPLSAQQSPQYYVLAQVLVLSGLAGLVARVPAGWPRRLIACLPVAMLGVWSAQAAPRLLTLGSGGGVGLHSETWSDPGQDLAVVVDDAVALAGERPVALSSQRVENLDALAELRHGRPIAWFFDNEFDRVDDFTAAYPGQELLLVLVDHAEYPSTATRPEPVWKTWRQGELRVQAWLISGQPGPDDDPCTWASTPRGLCLQRDWLGGGLDALRHPGR